MKKFVFVIGVLTLIGLLPVLSSAAAENSLGLQEKLDAANPGDIIVFSGVWHGPVSTKMHGESHKPITIRGENGAVIQGDDSDSGKGLTINHDYYILENFTIKTFQKGLWIDGASHGIAGNIVVEDTGHEGIKIRNGGRYWHLISCIAQNTGNSNGTLYGEGFYVGDASPNWAAGSELPDTSSYVIFSHCLALNTNNEGYDIKEGSHHIKIIDSGAKWENDSTDRGQGIAGVYSRGNHIQVSNFTVEGNHTGGPAFKLFQEDVAVTSAQKDECVLASTCAWLGVDGSDDCKSDNLSCVRYGGQVELKGIVVKDQNETNGQGVVMDQKCIALDFHRDDIVESSTLYKDYSIGDCELVDSGKNQMNPIEKEAAAFKEMTWKKDGGDNACFEMTINPGWNLLSLSMKQVEPTVETVLGQIKDHLVSAWKWKNGNWAVYMPLYGPAEFATYLKEKGFSALTAIDTGDGFWANSDTARSLSVKGTYPEATSVSIAEGWNLVGLKGCSPRTVAALVAGNEEEISSLWKWKGGNWEVSLPAEGDSGIDFANSKGFGHFLAINPGEGFWVNASAPLSLP